MIGMGQKFCNAGRISPQELLAKEGVVTGFVVPEPPPPGSLFFPDQAIATLSTKTPVPPPLPRLISKSEGMQGFKG